MACGKCPNCETQMVEDSVYGKKVCRCPDCSWKGPIKEKGAEGKLEYTKSPKDEKK